MLPASRLRPPSVKIPCNAVTDLGLVQDIMLSPALLVASESLPVVDIDNTIFLQALLFLFLLVVLNFVLFKPWLEVKERRAKRIGGALEDAVELRERAATRDQAMATRSERRREAEEQQLEIVGDARREAAKNLSVRKQSIAVEVDQARTELGSRVELLARDISTQVLGRSA